MAFALHRTAELAFPDAAAGLLAGNNPVAGALVVAALIAPLRSRPRARPGDRRHPGIRDGPARMGGVMRWRLSCGRRACAASRRWRRGSGGAAGGRSAGRRRSEEHTSELQSPMYLV